MKEILEKIFEAEKKCSCFKCQCEKCGSREMERRATTKQTGPKQYRLVDLYICKKCKTLKQEFVGEYDYRTHEEKMGIVNESETNEKKYKRRNVFIDSSNPERI